MAAQDPPRDQLLSSKMSRACASRTALTCHLHFKRLACLLMRTPGLFEDSHGCIQVAEQFRHEPGMWFPHNMDFRGRAYPMPPHLNHLGSDTSRGILQFAEGRALGEHGLEWLYIQVEQPSL